MNSYHSAFPVVCRSGWTALALPLVVVFAAPANWPNWAFMWVLAFAIYLACKILTWSAASINGVPLGRQLAYLAAWPGLDAAAFLRSDPSHTPPRPTAREWTAAVLKTLLGILIFWTAHRWTDRTNQIVLGWAGMIGFVLLLHFGLFHILSCAWRSARIDARPLMDAPLRSTSVTEFWGRRWNTAFRDFTHQFLFRPLCRATSPTAALVAVFFVSGLVHDAVISLPTGGGYGGPTCFFLLQAVAILSEKSRPGRALGLGRGVRGWLFTAIALLAPARLLFHDRFVTAVVLPFMTALGAA